MNNYKKRNCAYCGEEFMAKVYASRPRKYCRDQCRVRAFQVKNRQHYRDKKGRIVDMIKKKCEYCKEPATGFYDKSYVCKRCSSKLRSQSKDKRREEKRESRKRRLNKEKKLNNSMVDIRSVIPSRLNIKPHNRRK